MNLKKTERVIGLSGINAIDNPGPGVGVARSLKADDGLQTKIVGLAYDAMEPGIYMDWLIDKTFMMPYPSGDPAAYIERLAYIHNQYGLDMVFPNLDAELPLYIKCQHDIQKLGIKTFLPTAEQFRLRGKDRLHDVASDIGILCPNTKIVTSYEGLIKAIDTIGLPVMVKGAFYNAYRANTHQEAQVHYTQIVAEWGYPIIVQEIVSGEEMNVVGAGDGQGGCLGMVGIKKLLTTSLGKIWNGVTIRNQLMLDAASAFIKSSGWRGGFELECITDGDAVYLIEINPRLPAWIYFATGVGVNLPANMVRHVYGLPVDTSSQYDAGKLLIRYTFEQITDMEIFQKMSMYGEN